MLVLRHRIRLRAAYLVFITSMAIPYNLLDYVLQHAPIGITLADAAMPDTPIVYVNDGFMRITGYPPEETIGRNCRFLQAHDTRQPSARLMNHSIANGRGCRVVLRNYRKDETMFWNEVTIVPIHDTDNMLRYFLGVQHDVTAQRQYNELLMAYDVINEQMTNLEEQSGELRRVNEQLHESNARINDLAALLAHDLQNPISAMMSFIEILRDDTITLSREDTQLYANVAYETAERMLPIVKKLVDVGRLAKYQTEPLKLFALNAANIVELLATGYRHRAAAKEIQFDIDIPKEFWILSDENALYEVLDNLISNALKYTPHGKRIGVRMSSNITAGIDFVRIEVWDEGQGFSETDLSKLFSQGGKLSARPTGGESSTGLGLMAVKSLVAQMKGKVWCESIQGEGTRFFVEFRAASK
ncbi:MAG: PAS domain-containing protein [Candidatus Kapaibacterium sp.]|nr:MAG: PAS domain-containing protein [Candidatus Kapabacteria bacterium]